MVKKFFICSYCNEMRLEGDNNKICNECWEEVRGSLMPYILENKESYGFNNYGILKEKINLKNY